MLGLVKDLAARADMKVRTPGGFGRGGLTLFLVAAQTGNVAMMKQLMSLRRPQREIPGWDRRAAAGRRQQEAGSG